MRKVQIVFLILCLIVLPSLAQQTTWELTETLVINASGSLNFEISYPTGWQTNHDELVHAIAEMGQDLARLGVERFAVSGYLIEIERFRPRELGELGILTGLSVLDMIPILGEIQGFATDVDMQETTLLGWSALSLRTTDVHGNHLLIIAAYHGAALFMEVTLFAPSAEALDAFLPTWEGMLASIDVRKGLIELEGYALSYECKGEGSPTVILRSYYAGFTENQQFVSGSISDWNLIRSVSEITRVCFVIRRNELGPGLIQQHVEDLHNVLVRANIAPPYVMVGHYYGGMEVRIFADEFPDEVAGMVLINAVQEDINNRLREELTPQQFYSAYWSPADPDLLRLAATGSLDDMPLIVVTSESLGGNDPEIEAVEKASWAELTNLSSQSSQIIVSGSDPISVLGRSQTSDAILEVVALARAAAGQ